MYLGSLEIHPAPLEIHPAPLEIHPAPPGIDPAPLEIHSAPLEIHLARLGIDPGSLVAWGGLQAGRAEVGTTGNGRAQERSGERTHPAESVRRVAAAMELMSA